LQLSFFYFNLTAIKSTFYFKFIKTMEKWLKNSRKLMAMLAAVAFMLVAGWQFGVSGTEAPFSEKEVALEKAIEGSGGSGTTCYATYSPCYIFSCSYIYRCGPNPSIPCKDVRADAWMDNSDC
jgi:hypothetical protein